MSLHIYREDLLFEYLRIISEQQRQQSNAFLSYNRTVTSLHEAIRPILLRLFEPPAHTPTPRPLSWYQPIRTNVNTQTDSFRETASAPARLTTNYLNSQARTTARNRRPRPPPTYSFPGRTFPQTASRRPLLRVNRRNAITPQPTRNTIFQNILQTTLYANNTLNPLTLQDISNNTTTARWIDISANYEQEICPISQESFTPNDIVMRIRGCGHIFLENHLRTYLETYDYRCPVCRLDLRNINSNFRDASSNTTSHSLHHPTPTLNNESPALQTMIRDILIRKCLGRKDNN